MKKIGMIFPGQGSQILGMCKDLYDKERIVQELFEEASSCLDLNFVRLCFASSEKELRETVNAQTAIFLVSAAIATLLKTKYDIVPDVVAGHSSGEYAAIFAAGGMNFPDALYLLKKRALFMEEATIATPGSMLAIVGLPHEMLQTICNSIDDGTNPEQVAEIVNYNTGSQHVVSGTIPALELVKESVLAAGGKVLPLNVAGAFHSRLMKQAGELFAQYMVKVDFKDLKMPLVSNVDATKVVENVHLKHALARQMSAHVQWWPSMQHFQDCDIILEIGPGDKLTKMLKREWPDKEIIAVHNTDGINQVLVALGRPVIEQEHGNDCSCDACMRDEIKISVEPKKGTAHE